MHEETITIKSEINIRHGDGRRRRSKAKAEKNPINFVSNKLVHREAVSQLFYCSGFAFFFVACLRPRAIRKILSSTSVWIKEKSLARVRAAHEIFKRRLDLQNIENFLLPLSQ